MELKDFLKEVFPKKDEEKYTKMVENLKRLGFDSSSDLKYFDEETIKELESFSRIEIKKLTDYLTKCEFETLEEVLQAIFAGTSKDRIREIEVFLNQHKINFRRDILVVDLKNLRKKNFFSDIELMKIESFLEKNNRDYYNKILGENGIHKSDLIFALCDIFNGADLKRLSEIEEILKGQDIHAKNDLIYIDVDKFKQENILSEIELLKIETFLEENLKEEFHKAMEMKELKKSKDLRRVLHEIFFGTPTNRLDQIEQILNDEQIYSGHDILINDLNNLQHKDSLSNAEMLKLEEYLKKKNVEHYEKLMSERELEKSKNLKYILKQIFVNTPEDRLAKIEGILKESQIYSGSDMKIVDTNDLREKSSLSDIEILKIEEYIKNNNRERYEDIKAVKMALEERKFTRLRKEDEKDIYALTKAEELKFIQLKAQEEQKMIEFKADRERLLREEQNELMKAKEKEDKEKEEMKFQREIELIKARAKEEMEKENMKLQREKELMEARAKEEDMKMQREKELMDAKAKDDIERENKKLQIEIELIQAKTKEEMERETTKMQIERKLREEKLKEEMEREKIIMQREKELREANLKEEMERENLKIQREKELREEKIKDEMEREKIELQREQNEMQREKLLREVKLKEEIEREKINMQREKELREAKLREDIERENMKMQRERELREESTKEETEREKIELKRKKIEMQKEKELREGKLKEDMERENMKIEREKGLREEKAKEMMERENAIMQRELSKSLIKEKNELLEDIRDLEKECISLKNVITETGAQTGLMAYFKNSRVQKKKAEDELKEKKKSLKSKKDRIYEIDKFLRAKTGF